MSVTKVSIIKEDLMTMVMIMMMMMMMMNSHSTNL